MGRRELIWAAAPLFSLAAAAGMYGLAQAVKGDESAAEIHHLLVGTDAQVPFRVTTAVRIQSAEKGVRNLSVAANEPTLLPVYDYRYQSRDRSSPHLSATRNRIDVSSFAMQKWSTRDFVVDSVSAPYRIYRTQHSDETVTIKNAADTPLKSLYYLHGIGWYKFKDGIAGGEEKVFRLSQDEQVWDTETAATATVDPMLLLLYSVRKQYSNREILAAECTPLHVPKVTVTPFPKIIRETTNCIFLFNSSPAGADVQAGATSADGVGIVREGAL
jgi:hypothetical protein